MTATDAAGNISAPTSITAPDTQAPAAPTFLLINDAGDQLTGRGEPGTTVSVTNAVGAVLATGSVGANADFTVALVSPQLDGGQIEVVLTDSAGNASPAASILAPNLIAPPAPADLSISTDGTMVSGTGTVGATITISNAENSVIVGTGTVLADGTFSIILAPAQINAQVLNVTATYANGTSQPGQISAPSLTSPVLTNLAINANGTILSGTGPVGVNATVTDAEGNSVGTAVVPYGGVFTITLTSAQTNGGLLTVTLEDSAGNIGTGTINAPNLTPPAATTCLNINASGTTLTGNGEAGASVMVTDANDFTVGSGIVNATGQFSVSLSPAQINGGVLTVVLINAAHLQSTPATINAPTPLAPKPKK